MAFVLLYMPCIVVIAAMRQEFGGGKWPAVAVGYSTLLAWVVSLIIYQGGKFLGL
jgi:ferrous iron transport protein B